MDQVCNTLANTGDRGGGRLVKTITPRAADKLYDKFIERAPGSLLMSSDQSQVAAAAWYRRSRNQA